MVFCTTSMRSRPSTMIVLTMMMVVGGLGVSAFLAQPNPPSSLTRTTGKSDHVHSRSHIPTFLQKNGNDKGFRKKQKNENKAASSAEFELQELRVQLDAMKANGIRSRDLDPVTRATLENYMRQIALQRPSPVRMDQMAEALPQTSWRLVLSTESAMLGELPPDATVYINFIDGINADYTLQFGKKTFGLSSIKAKSKWTCDRQGLVTLVYDKITTDAFGFQNIGVAFFGLLQGRSNSVQTAYFDNSYWIERGVGPTGEDFLNVYVRED